MAQMEFSQLIIGQIECLKPSLSQGICHLVGLSTVTNLQAHIDMGCLGISNAVVKLSNVAIANNLTESFKASPLLRDGDGKHRLALLTNLRPFTNKTKPIKIHIRTTGNGDQGLPLHSFAINPVLHAGNCKRTRRL